MKHSKLGNISQKPTARRKLYLAIAAQLMLAHQAQAAPSGGDIVGGQGSITQTGQQTTINQETERLSIDWQTFNIEADERVQFIQPSDDSVALNRVLTNDASHIFGQLDANGTVVLVNPNGVYFGENATVNVGSLVASGLMLNTDEFMNGDFVFEAIDGADGAVINSGLINASVGGSVALIGKKVENEGLISAKLGSVSLAAGKEAILSFDNQGLIGVRVSKEVLQDEIGLDEAAVNNSGDIHAEGGKILLTASASRDVFSQAVNAGGFKRDASVVVHDDGSFTLGGGANLVNSGELNVSSSDQDAGAVVLLGENISQSGQISADANGSGAAGFIEVQAKDLNLQSENAKLSAVAKVQGQGGDIKVLGSRVGVLDQTVIDARGANGGGSVKIGGDYQGRGVQDDATNEASVQIPNAQRTVLSADTQILANAIQDGDGGKVIVWSDETTAFTGEISVAGGALGGDGGFVEVSGKQNLKFDGRVDLSSERGEGGELLLDPDVVFIRTNIHDSELSDDNQILFDDSTDAVINAEGFSSYYISPEAISQALASGDVNIQAEAKIWFDGTESSPIKISTPDEFSTSSLILEAGLFIGGQYTEIVLGEGDLVMLAGIADWCTGCVSEDFGQFGPYVDGTEGIGWDNSALATNGDIYAYSYDDLYLGRDIATRSIYLGHDLDGNKIREATNITLGSQRYLEIILANEWVANGNVDIVLGDLNSEVQQFNIASGNPFTLPAFRDGEITQGASFLKIQGDYADFGEIDLRLGGDFSVRTIGETGQDYAITISDLQIDTSFLQGSSNITIQGNGQVSAPGIGPSVLADGAQNYSATVNLSTNSDSSGLFINRDIYTSSGDFQAASNTFIYTGSDDVVVDTKSFQPNSSDEIQGGSAAFVTLGDNNSGAAIVLPNLNVSGYLTIISGIYDAVTPNGFNNDVTNFVEGREVYRAISTDEQIRISSYAGTTNILGAGNSIPEIVFASGNLNLNNEIDTKLVFGNEEQFLLSPTANISIQNNGSITVGPIESYPSINLDVVAAGDFLVDGLVNLNDLRVIASNDIVLSDGSTILASGNLDVGAKKLIQSSSSFLEVLGKFSAVLEQYTLASGAALEVVGEIDIQATDLIEFNNDSIFNPLGPVNLSSDKDLVFGSRNDEAFPAVDRMILGDDYTDNFQLSAGSRLLLNTDLDAGNGNLIFVAGYNPVDPADLSGISFIGESLYSWLPNENGIDMSTQRLATDGEIIFKSSEAIYGPDAITGDILSNDIAGPSRVSFHANHQVVLPYILLSKGDVDVKAYDNAANELSNVNLSGQDINFPTLTRLLDPATGYIGWNSNIAAKWQTNGGNINFASDEITRFGYANLDTSSSQGHGDITMIATGNLETVPIKFTNTLDPGATDRTTNIYLEAGGELVVSGDIDLNNAENIQLDIVSTGDGDVHLGKLGSEGDYYGGTLFDSSTATVDLANIDIQTNGIVRQKYQWNTFGGNVSTNTSEWTQEAGSTLNTFLGSLNITSSSDLSLNGIFLSDNIVIRGRDITLNNSIFTASDINSSDTSIAINGVSVNGVGENTLSSSNVELAFAEGGLNFSNSTFAGRNSLRFNSGEANNGSAQGDMVLNGAVFDTPELSLVGMDSVDISTSSNINFNEVSVVNLDLNLNGNSGLDQTDNSVITVLGETKIATQDVSNVFLDGLNNDFNYVSIIGATGGVTLKDTNDIHIREIKTTELAEDLTVVVDARNDGASIYLEDSGITNDFEIYGNVDANFWAENVYLNGDAMLIGNASLSINAYRLDLSGEINSDGSGNSLFFASGLFKNNENRFTEFNFLEGAVIGESVAEGRTNIAMVGDAAQVNISDNLPIKVTSNATQTDFNILKSGIEIFLLEGNGDGDLITGVTGDLDLQNSTFDGANFTGIERFDAPEVSVIGTNFDTNWTFTDNDDSISYTDGNGDSQNIAISNLTAISAGEGNDVFNFNQIVGKEYQNAVIISGNGGSDTIKINSYINGLDSVVTQRLDGHMLNFDSAQDFYTGSKGLDDYTASNSRFQINGVENIEGGSGTDLYIAWTQYIFDGSTGFGEHFDGGDGEDYFFAADWVDFQTSSNTWNITGVNQGNVDSYLTFQNVENIGDNTATSGAFAFEESSIFNFSTGAQINSVLGGSGDDVFLIEEGAQVGRIVGGDGFDELFSSANSNDWLVNSQFGGQLEQSGAITPVLFEEMESVVGSVGSDTFNIATNNDIGLTLYGYDLNGPGPDAGAVDQIISTATVDHTWTIDGDGLGRIELSDNPSSGSNFYGITNIQSGAGDDSILLNASFSGSISGGAGNDVFSQGAADAIATIDGGDGAGDVFFRHQDSAGRWLMAADSAEVYSVDELGNAASEGITLVGFEQATGSQVFADEFIFGNTIPTNFSISAGDDAAAIDVVDYSQVLGAIDVSVDASGNLGGIEGAELIIGNNNTDVGNGSVLRLAEAVNSRWDIEGNDGDSSLTFSGKSLLFRGFNNLVGNTGNDHWTMNGNLSFNGEIHGNAGSDIIEIDYSANQWVISDFGEGNVTSSGGGNNSFYTFDEVETAIGCNRNDLFDIQTTNINGMRFEGRGGSEDRILISAAADALFTMTGESAGNFSLEGNTASFSQMEALEGNANQTNTLVGADRLATWTINDLASDSSYTLTKADETLIDMAFSQMHILQGGTGEDAFFVEDQANSIQIIGGDGDLDTLWGFNANDTQQNIWSVSGAYSGDLNGNVQFSQIENLQGNANNDVINFAANATIGDIQAGQGNDVINMASGVSGGTFLAGTDGGVINELDSVLEVAIDKSFENSLGQSASYQNGKGLVNPQNPEDNESFSIVWGENSETVVVGLDDYDAQWRLDENGNLQIEILADRLDDGMDLTGAIFDHQGVSAMEGAGGSDRFILSSAASLKSAIVGDRDASGVGVDSLQIDNNANNIWQINNINQGQVTLGDDNSVASFEGISQLLGGALSDEFNFAALGQVDLIQGNDLIVRADNDLALPQITVNTDGSLLVESITAGNTFNVVADQALNIPGVVRFTNGGDLLLNSQDNNIADLAFENAGEVLIRTGHNINLLASQAQNLTLDVQAIQDDMGNPISASISQSGMLQVSGLTDIKFESQVGGTVFLDDASNQLGQVDIEANAPGGRVTIAGDGDVSFGDINSNINVEFKFQSENASLTQVDNSAVVLSNGANFYLDADNADFGGQGTSSIQTDGGIFNLTGVRTANFDGVLQGASASNLMRVFFFTENNPNGDTEVNFGSNAEFNNIDVASANVGFSGDSVVFNAAASAPFDIDLNGTVNQVNLLANDLSLNLIGGTGEVTLQASDQDNNWQIGDAQSGQLNSTLVFANFDKLIGGSGDDDFVFTSTTPGALTLDGGAGNNSIAAKADENASWQLFSDGSVSYLAQVNAQNINAIQGSDLDDNFVWQDLFASSLVIDAGTGSNSFDYSQVAGAMDVQLADQTINGVQVGNTINQVIGNGSQARILGDDVAHQWTITGDLSGSLETGLSFTQFGTVVAGQATNGFTIEDATAIMNIVGQGAQDVIRNNDASIASTWNINGQYSGTLNSNLNFSGIELILGSTNNEVFNVTGLNAVVDVIRGRGGNDIFNINSSAAVMELYGSAGDDQFNIMQATITLLDAGAGADTIVLESGANVSQVNGGLGSDEVVVKDGAQLFALDGGSDPDGNDLDYLNILDLQSAVRRNLVTGNTDLSFSYDNFENVSDTQGGTTLFAGEAGGDFEWHFLDDRLAFFNGGFLKNVEYDSFTNIESGLGEHTFIYEPNANFVSNIVASAQGSNTLVANTLVDAWAIDGINSGQMWSGETVLSTFQNIGSLVGSTSAETFAIGTNGSIESIVGGGGTNILLLQDDGVANSWNLGSSKSVDGKVQSFTGIQTLQSGDDDDNYIFDESFASAPVVNQIQAGGGNNSVVWQAATGLVVDLDNPVLDGLVNVSGINAYEVTAGNGSIQGKSTGSTWVLSSATSGSVNDGSEQVSFSGFNNLSGAQAGVDTLVGPDEDATWQLSSVTDGQLSAGGEQSNFANMDEIQAGSGDDTLVGADVASSWVIDNLNSGSVDSLSFSGIENILGGSASDDFQLTALGQLQSLNSGAGDDIVVLAQGSSVASLDGGDGDDSLDLSDLQSAVRRNLVTGETDLAFAYQNFEDVSNTGLGTTVYAEGADDSFEWRFTENGLSFSGAGVTDLLVDYGNFDGVESGAGTHAFIFEDDVRYQANILADESASNSLMANNLIDQWLISGINSGQMSGDGGAVASTFQNIAQLIGGSADETFTIEAGASIASIDGGAGSNTLVLIDDGAANLWSLGATHSVDQVASFERLQNLVGGDDDDSLVFEQGFGSGSTVDSISTGAGNNSLTWNLAQGLLVNLDTSTLNNAINVQGINQFSTANANGSLQGSSAGSTWTLNSATSGSVDDGSAAVAFDGFSLLMGSSTADDLLQGPDLDATWSLDGLDQGDLSVGGDVSRFQSMNALQGGDANDTWVLSESAGSSQGIDGGLGDDLLQAATGSINSFIVDGNASGQVNGLVFSGIEDLAGGNQGDSFSLSAGGQIRTIQAGSGNDAFTLEQGAVFNLIDAGEGQDQLSINEGDNNWLLDQQGGSLNGMGFQGIEAVQGGIGNDVFELLAAVPEITDVKGGEGYDSLLGADGNNIWDLSSASLNSTIVFAQMEMLVGGSQEDSLVAPDTVNTWLLSADQGTVNGTDFQGMDRLIGGSAVDTYELAANANVGHIEAGAGDDIVTIGENAQVLSISLGADNDSLSMADGVVVSGAVLGGDGSDRLDISAFSQAFEYNYDTKQTDGGLEYDEFEDVKLPDTGSSFFGGAGDTQWVFTDAESFYIIKLDQDGNVLETSETFSGYSAVRGGDAQNTFALAADQRFDGEIRGSALGNNSLEASDLVNQWLLVGTNSGELSGDAGATTLFSNIANLVGGSAADSFVIQAGGSITGSLEGGLGRDSLMISDANATNLWQLGTQNSVSAVASFAGIEDLVGNANNDQFNILGASDVLSIDGGAGQNAVLWDAGEVLVNLPSQQLNALSFQNIAAVQGQAGASNVVQGLDADSVWTLNADDSFELNTAGSQMSFNNFTQIDAGAGADQLIVVAGNLSGGFNAGEGEDSIVAADTSNSWELEAVGGRLNTTSFSGVEWLEGGSADDSFVMLAATTEFMGINGGAGSDSLQAFDQSNAWQINSTAASSVTGIAAFEGIETYIGGNQDDNFVVEAGSTFAEIYAGAGNDIITIGRNVTADNIWAESGDDKVEIHQGFTLSGVVDGGTDNLNVNGSKGDLLNLGNISVSMLGPDIQDLVGFSFENFEDVVDPGHDGSYTGDNSNTDWFFTGNNSGYLVIKDGPNQGTYDFSDITQIFGGSGTDNFYFESDEAIAQISIDGGEGADNLIDFSSQTWATDWLLNGANAGTVKQTGANVGDVEQADTGMDLVFSNIAYLLGSGGNDSVRIEQGASLSGGFEGGSGFDQLVAVTGVNNNWVVNATGLELNAQTRFNNIESIIGGDLNDTFVLMEANAQLVNIEGMAGSDSLVIDYAGNSQLDLDQAQIEGLEYGSLEAIEVGEGLNQVLGANQNTQWTLASDGSIQVSYQNTDGVVNLSLVGFNQLQGGAADDNFSVQAGSQYSGALDGGEGNDQLAVESGDHQWLVQSDNAGTLDQNTQFNNIENLVGGSGRDRFEITAGANISGSVDGGGSAFDELQHYGDSNTWMLNSTNGRAGVSVDATNYVGIERLTALGQNNILEGGDSNNTWNIDGADTSYVDVNNDVLQRVFFSGMASYLGGSGADRFNIANLAALPNNLVGGAGDDIVNLQLVQADINVALGNASQLPVSGFGINIEGVETLQGNSDYSTVVYGNSDQAYTWTVDGLRSASVRASDTDDQTLYFEDISALVGGDHDDTFVVTTNSTSITLDGGLAQTIDFVDYSQVNANLSINLAEDLNTEGGVIGIEGIRGNSPNAASLTSAELVATDAVNTWEIGELSPQSNADGVNDGSLSYGGQKVYFEDFNILSGGASADTFNQGSGGIRGQVNGGDGNDTFNASVAGLNAGTIFDGGNGNDVLNLSGGEADVLATYTAVGNGGRFDYSGASTQYSISHSNVESLNDNVLAATLSIRGGTQIDTFQMRNGRFAINQNPAVIYSNKTNLRVDADANDTVDIQENIAVDGTFAVVNAGVVSTNPGATSITAQQLSLINVRDVGTANARIQTAIDRLSIENAEGDIYLVENSGLDLVNISTQGEVDILVSDGDLVASGVIESQDDLSLSANNGDINLLEDNRLEGNVRLIAAAGDVHLVNTDDLRLAQVEANNATFEVEGSVDLDGEITIANNLHIEADDDIDGNDLISVGALAEFETSRDISLTHQDNDFNRIAIKAADNVELVVGDDVELVGIEIEGDFELSTAGDVHVSEQLVAHNIDLQALQGTALLDAVLDADPGNDVVVMAEDIIQNADIFAGRDIRLIASNDLERNASLLAQNEVELSAENITVADSANTGGREVNIIARGDLTINSDINGDNVNIGGDRVVIDGNVTAVDGNANVTGGSEVAVNGNINADNDVNLSTNDGDVNQSGSVVAGGNVAVEAGGQGNVNMSDEATTEGTNVSVTAGNDVGLGGVTAGNNAQVSAGGEVKDGNGDKQNITAETLDIDAGSGVGKDDALDTDVRVVDINNGENDVKLDNKGGVQVDSIVTKDGDVDLKSEDDIGLADGAIDARGSDGKPSKVTLDSAEGGVKATGPGDIPAVVSDVVVIEAPNGAVGEGGLNVDADRVDINARYKAGALIVKAGTDLNEYFSGSFKFEDQIVSVEQLEETNPAVFTNVKSYFHNDVSLRLPLDQLYEEDEEDY